MRRTFVFSALTLLLILTTSAAVSAQTPAADRFDGREPSPGIEGLKLDSPFEVDGISGGSLSTGLVADAPDGRVIVRLRTPSVADRQLRGSAARQHKANIVSEQNSLLSRLQALDPGARVLATVQVVMNAVFVEIDASVLDEVARDPSVLRVAPVGDYELDLSETVPYIGASAVQAKGFDGSGIRVAVLDSGIDYTHAAYGGSGDPADYAANNPNIIEPGTFPTPKVVGGFDFVGSVWPEGPEAPDPDPLDDGPEAGHGTHVGHILGGKGGVAPGVDLYAVKVCSSVSTSCSGVSLIQGMEFAVDPNGDGDPADAVDVINMSLGASYGQPFDDDLSQAVDAANFHAGVLTVASAGNSADKPYANGTPSAAVTALSVAQTQVPSAALQMIAVDGANYPAVFQPWSVPPTGVLTGPVQYGDGAGGNLDGCAPFAGSLTDMIVLVDRGACNFTLKISNISQAGGLAGIIGLIAPGAPFEGGDGGDRPIDIPGYMISQADSNAIKAAIADSGATGTIDPANQLPLVGQMVGSSSRGPQHEDTQLVKPEIGAPGGSVSAIAGTGTGEGPFGGTSGSAPMVSGSAALLLEASPKLGPLEVKARLMNTGETDIDTDPFTGLAPITRIGGGEVRVDRAVASPAAAWENGRAGTGALSFGFVDVDKDTVVLRKAVRVRNYSPHEITYTLEPTFRFPDDAANGAVSIEAPKTVKVGARRDATFTVVLTIRGGLLRGNFMNSGSMGADASGLTTNEYDGYIVLNDGSRPIHLAWHVLPRKDANVTGRSQLQFTHGSDTVELTNNGVGTAQNDAYSLLATSPNQPEGPRGGQSPTPDIHTVGINTFIVPSSFCESEFVWAFTVNSWERQEHLLPVSHQFWLDTNQDGTDDFVVLNRDVTFSDISDGRQLAWALDLETGDASAFFFAEHSMNTGNTVLYICGEQVGLTADDILNTNVDMDVVAQDFYYGGPGDLVEGLTVTPLGERYFGSPTDIPGKSTGTLNVTDFGAFPGNTDELGVMLVTNGDRGAGNRGGATKETEALLFLAP